MKIYWILIFSILLVIITAGTVSASNQTDYSSDSLGEESDMYLTECSDDETAFLNDNADESSFKNSGEISNDNRYYLFRGDCWTLSNNFESSAAITSETPEDFTVTGTFRTENDFVGIYWNSKDIIQHPYITYGERSNYSDVILEFDYEMTNCTDFSNNSINIVMATNNGETYFLSMNRFIQNSHVTLDFNNLTLLAGNSFMDSNGLPVQIAEETKLDVSDLKYVMFEILPVNFIDDVHHTITANTDFKCRISNITVSNGEICTEQVPLPVHQYRLCEGYDDMYNMNPFRISKEMRKLGYAEWVDLYIGASYFYEKSGIIGDVITEMNFNHNRTEKMVLNKDMPLNKAFRAWLDCYARELKNNDVSNLIISVSMENLQCPQSWRQMDCDGNFAMSGWNPSTFFYSPSNEDVILYMQKVSEACLDIVAQNGLKPILQMGETWWWWSENNWSSPAPCFYDNSTRAKYLKEMGSELPVYSNAWASEYDKDAMKWLNHQLSIYSDALRDTVKSDKYADGVYMALLFTPYVVDEDRVPPMMRDVNYLRDAYSPSKLDVLQIEDYDWVIFEDSHHSESYTIGQELGFTGDNLHYFGGFVQNPQDADKYWDLIIKAMDDAVKNKFKEVFVWAGPQVRRDSKILGYDEAELIRNLSPTTLTAPDYVSVGENFTVKIQTQKWLNGYLNIYDYNSDVKGNLIISNKITNGSSSAVLSSNTVGLNRIYVEFNYSGCEYHLIQQIYVIENSPDVTVDIADEIELGDDLNIILKAPEAKNSSLRISIDENASICYNVENGEFRKAISDLPAGYHTISLKYDGGKLYSNTFTVNVCYITLIEASELVCNYASGENFLINLKDSNGNVLKGKEILINLNGFNYTVVSDDKGQAALTVDLLPGNYSADIVFKGGEGYFSSSNTSKITVNKLLTRITAPSISTTYNVAKNLIVTLKDASGNLLVGENVIVKLNGKLYNKSADENGQVKIPVSLNAKKYNAAIFFEGTGIYMSSTLTSKVVVNKATPKLTASSKTFKAKTKTKKVSVMLKNNKNKAIKKVTVYLKVNKKTYKVKTNSKGVATFKVKLTKKGKYAAVYKYYGNSNYKSVSKKVKITVK